MRKNALFVCRNVLQMIALVSMLAAAPPQVNAGKLEDFERDATRADRVEDANARREAESDDDHYYGEDFLEDVFFNPFEELIVDGIVTGMMAGGHNSMRRVDARPPPLSARRARRMNGEALIPFVRFDAALQDVESDVSAWDYRGEIGYGAFGAQYRRSLYAERTPRESLEVIEYFALYRMSFGRTLEIDLGIGEIALKGREQHRGTSFTLPVLIHPSRSYGLEFRPSWSTIKGNDLHNIDLAFLAGWRYFSFRAGYHWFRSERESLDGPYIGAAVRW